MKFSIVLLMTVLLFTATVAAAQSSGVVRHPEIDRFIETGGKAEFIGNAYGLDGWLLIRDGQPEQTVYTTPQGGLVMGMLVGPDGIVRTSGQLVAFKAKVDGSQAALAGAENSNVSKAEKIYAAIEKLKWIRVGNEKAPYIYMFMNVGCGHCQKFWQDLQKPIKDGRLHVRLLPFGKQAENREGGAALLSAADPASAWNAYIKGDKSALGKDKIKGDALKSIDANTAILNTWKVSGNPPFTFYRKLTDGQITAIVGLPKNSMLLMADLMR